MVKTDGMAGRVPRAQHRFRYKTLDQGEKDVYDAMLDGLLAHRDRIELPRGARPDRVGDLFNYLHRDIPELFYVGDANYQYPSDWRTAPVTLLPNYRMSQEEALAFMDRMESHCGPFILSLRGVDEVKKICRLHDWLVEQFTYVDQENPADHEAPGPLVYGTAVCEGAAKAFKFLCDRAGVECCVVQGVADGVSHAWNAVRLGAGKWVHVDTTFDACISQRDFIRHDYLGLSDAEVGRDHAMDAGDPHPRCLGRLRYYEREGLFVTTAESLGRVVDQGLSKSGHVEFKLSGPVVSAQEADKRVCQAIAAHTALGRAGRQYTLGPNYRQMVFEVAL